MVSPDLDVWSTPSMCPSPFRSLPLVAILALAVFLVPRTAVLARPRAAAPAPQLFRGKGAVDAGAAAAALEAAIGGQDNGDTAGTQTGGFRAVNWDDVALDGTDFGNVSTVIAAHSTVAVPRERYQARGLFLDGPMAV